MKEKGEKGEKGRRNTSLISYLIRGPGTGVE